MSESIYTALPPDKIELLKRTVAIGLSDDELKLFLHMVERTGLDPFARQIHCVKRGNKVAVQTGIDGYRLIADRTGKYAGSDDYRFDNGLDEYQHIQMHRGNPVTATVTVYKLVGGIRCAFTATVRWDEYFPGKSQGYMWDRMPYLMLGKTAEALALRKAFPAELSGLYTDEEMQQADAEGNDTGGRESTTNAKGAANNDQKAGTARARAGVQGDGQRRDGRSSGRRNGEPPGKQPIPKDDRERIINTARAKGWKDDHVLYLLRKRYHAASTKEVMKMDLSSILADLNNEETRDEIRAEAFRDELSTDPIPAGELAGQAIDTTTK